MFKAEAMASTVLKEGLVVFFSILYIVEEVMPTLLASCSWVSPCLCLDSFIFSPSPIIQVL